MILPQPSWSKAPEIPTLRFGDVHLWRAPLTDYSRISECLNVLSHQEIIRAEKFVFEKDRREFVISHGAVRMVLSRYCGITPEELEFAAGSNGKPQLVQQFTDFRFNLSHTDGLALIALTRGHDVGVDVERVNKSMSFQDIAEHYFEPCELWDLRIAPPDERVTRFFEVWTRKEAALKATGDGLAALGRSKTFNLDVRSLRPADGYAGAVACAALDWRLACWDWTL
jgi:4'-phosphopantetheinyl transferase